MFNPWLILGAIVAAIALATGSFVGGAKYEKGQQARRDMAIEQGKTRAVLRAMENNTAEQLANEAKARKASKDHASELSAIRAEFERASTGGLRITADACRSLAPATAEAASTSRPDAATTGSIALPAAVEWRLRELAREADETLAIARALQEWIIANGFYGPAEPAK